MQRRLPRRRLDELVFPVHAGAGQVRVEIDQPWKDRCAAEVDDPRARWRGQRAADGVDPIAAYDDDRRLERRAPGAVDQAGRSNDDRRRWTGLRGERRRRGDEDANELLHGSDSRLMWSRTRR